MGGLSICVSVSVDGGSVSVRGGGGRRRMGLQGRLAELSAMLTRDVKGRGPAPSLRGTPGTWRRLFSRPEPRKGSLQVFLGGAFLVHMRVPPGELGKVLPEVGLAQGTLRHSLQESYPNTQRSLLPRCPPHLQLPSRSPQGTGTLSRWAAPELPRARLDLLPG